jgi:pimeloyl-ACP methyl ester carboxylesterase
MKPLLLLIPGMLNDAAVWARLLPLLQDLAEIRVADVSRQASINEMARDAWAQLADVPDPQPLVLAGFSMGGYVLMQMLAQEPRRAAALVFIDTSARVETADTLPIREKTLAAMARNFDRLVEQLAVFNTHAQSQGKADLMDEVRSGLRRVGAVTGMRQLRAIMARSDHRAMLSKLEQPALVLCGRDDKVTPPEGSEELAAIMARARLVWIEDAGHMTVLEQPQQVAEPMRALLLAL